MQCYCNPPLPVKLSRSTKSGPNHNRAYLSCPAGLCATFICWEGETPRRPPPRNEAISHDNKLLVKLYCGEIESGPPARAWFCIACHMDRRMTSYLNTIPSDLKRFSTAKVWSFDFQIYDQFVGTLQSSEFSPHVSVSELPRFLVKGVKAFLSLPAVSPEVDLPESMMDTLLPFQLQAVEFVIRRAGRAMIADEMGCGKTIEALAVLLHYRRHLPALIMCPPNLIAQWQGEVLDRCFDIINQHDVCVVRNTKDKIYGKVCIISYTMLENFVSRGALSTSHFGTVIADESHALKTKDAKRTTLALPLLKRAKVALCLTGTPAVNRPVELFTQLNAIRPDIFDSYDTFTQRYCDPKKARFHSGVDVSGSCNEAELKSVLDGLVMIRRLKSEVISNLPSKSREVRKVQPDPHYVPQLKELKDEMEAVKKAANDSSNSTEASEILNQQARTLMNRLCCVTGMSKIQRVTQEIERLVKQSRESRKQEMQTRAAQVDEAMSIGTTSHESGGSKSLSVDDDLLFCGEEAPAPPEPRPSSQQHSYSGQTDFGFAVDVSDGCDSGGHRKQSVDGVISLLEEDCITTGTLRKDGKAHDERSSKRSRQGNGQVVGSPDGADDLPSAEAEGLIDSDDDSSGVVNARSKGPNGRKAAKGLNAVSLDDDSEECSDKNSDEDFREETADEDDDDEDIFFSKKTMTPKRTSKVTASSVARRRKTQGGSSPADWRGVLDYDEASKAPSKKRKKGQSDRILPIQDSVATGSAHNPSGQSAPIGQKILVFAHHAEVMDAIENCLRRLDVGYIRIDGKVTVASRTALISKFQNDDQIDIALLSVTACGTGLNLTQANVAVFAELVWGAGQILQAEDRIHRLGQKSKTVRIIYILCEGTSDQIVWDLIQKKHRVLASTVGIDVGGGGQGGMQISKPTSRNQPSLDTYMSASQVYGGSTSTGGTLGSISIGPTISSPSKPPTQLSMLAFTAPRPAGAQASSETGPPYVHGQGEGSSPKKTVYESTAQVPVNPAVAYAARLGASAACTALDGQSGPSTSSPHKTHLQAPAADTRTEHHAQSFTRGSSMAQPKAVPEISPEVMARIEANRRLALEKRKRAQLSAPSAPANSRQLPQMHHNESLENQSSIRAENSVSTMCVNPHPAQLLQEVKPIQSFQSAPTANKQAGHIFKTGGGSSVAVTGDDIRRASERIEHGQAPTSHHYRGPITDNAPHTVHVHYPSGSMGHLPTRGYVMPKALQTQPTLDVANTEHVALVHANRSSSAVPAAFSKFQTSRETVGGGGGGGKTQRSID